MVTSPSMPVQLASPEVSPALTSSIPLAIPTLSPPNNRLEDFDSAFQGLRAAVERGEANLFQPLAAALDAIVKLGDDLKVCIHCLCRPAPYRIAGAVGGRERVCRAQSSGERVSRDCESINDRQWRRERRRHPDPSSRSGEVSTRRSLNQLVLIWVQNCSDTVEYS